MRTTTSFPLALGALAIANVLGHRVAPRAAPVIAAGQTVILGLIARSAGVTRDGIGLTSWRSGLRWGSGSAAAVAAGYLVVLAVPAARSAIAGSGAGRSEALRRAFVTIPLTTVIPEEFAFRGVLLGILGADRRSAIVTSMVFGIWHVLPALGDGPANDTVGAVIGEGRRGVAVRAVGTVLVTSVGGLMMAASRLRSRSLLAPILMHWAVNGIGELVSAHR